MWLINGQADTGISPLDRGLGYGDGVFRTLKVRAGAPVWWADHYAVLARDCAALALTCPDRDLLLDEISSVVGDSAEAIVKITVTRGLGHRGYASPNPSASTRIVASYAVPDYSQQVAQGVSVRWCALRLSRQTKLAGVKHLNRLENVLARNEWSDPNITEGLLCDHTGAVIGGTMTNIFAIHGGQLWTPDLSQSGINGVTRARILRAAQLHHIDVHVARLDAADILAADEVFLSNSIAGLWRVNRLEDKQWTSTGGFDQYKRWIYETD